MTDRDRHETDGRLQATYAQARADLSRRRQEVQELGEFLKEFGQALLDRPHRIAIAPAHGVFKDEDWFLVRRDLPTLSQVQNLLSDLEELASKVDVGMKELQARGLPL